MIPTLAFPGDSTPGQLGPISRDVRVALQLRVDAQLVVAGMPSVMQMIVAMPASSASRIESAAKRGGTKIIAVFAARSPLDGAVEVTPATTSVP